MFERRDGLREREGAQALLFERGQRALGFGHAFDHRTTVGEQARRELRIARLDHALALAPIEQRDFDCRTEGDDARSIGQARVANHLRCIGQRAAEPEAWIAICLRDAEFAR